MNKVLKGLLVTLLAVSAAQVKAASDYSNRTFLAPRSHGVNLPLTYTTFGHLLADKDDDRFGGNLQVTGYYQASTNNAQTGKYFSATGRDNTTVLGRVAANTNNAPGSTNPAVAGNDTDFGYIIHKYDGTANSQGATVTLNPLQTAWGINFDYHQDLEKIAEGLYFNISVPVVQVTNDPQLNVTSANATDAADLTNYFKGNFEQTGTNNKQDKLKFAKIDGKQQLAGVADIDMALGYKFLDHEDYHAGVAFAVTVPTGNVPTGEYLFEPVVGNGKHVAVGVDACGNARVWGDKEHSVNMSLGLKYRYLFESAEVRTAGIDGNLWGQYALLGLATGTAAQSLQPAANVTTLSYNVTPGSQVDMTVGASYSYSGFNMDLGYNLYYRDAETAKLKDTYTDGKFVIAARNTDAASAATTPLPQDGSDAAVDAKYLLKPETPSQLTHAFYSGFGYMFKDWENPLMLGVHGKYEWTQNNNALEQWSVGGKVGIGF